NPGKDFKEFDYIITMDDENYRDITSMDTEGNYTNKIHKMMKFCKTNKTDEVPDPYYDGSEGFEKVLNILEDACNGLLEKIIDDNK
ncbi:MAG: low molecular weight phosphotyrosine protein phosphatase, partial [Bacteroidetes bacterium]|nr:low molecular weight phosphotyrosine protein phosphatase [Bacteroidota bacterium]